MESISRNPEFVIVPGAWHSPESFKPTTDILQAKGYKVHGIYLKSVGASPPLEDFQPDVEVIRNTIESLLAKSTPIILIYHSYGGTVGSEALSSYLKTLPPSTTPSSPYGLIRRLIYITAFVFPRGTSLMSTLGYKPAPGTVVSDDSTVTRCVDPYADLYHDIPRAEAGKYIDMLKDHSYKTFDSPVEAEPWRFIPSTYIACENDRAIPLAAQLGMIARAQEMAEGSFDTIERTNSGHSPFISQPEWLAEKLIKAAESSV
ncbi:hypothetical protein DSL72_001534 [Monilinia vaccinii-corymbosi]|uniref:AB hydrolase-1 domain-containing protein n=1 Tax=Monilinia vaccinii-corymbosi TaxID=61207 RepID=A0A8A3P250_9HELO|nr:hypothetical protein DSL72_001534 [Monilinia vaccinii-corymbosi]